MWNARAGTFSFCLDVLLRPSRRVTADGSLIVCRMCACVRWVFVLSDHASTFPTEFLPCTPDGATMPTVAFALAVDSIHHLICPESIAGRKR